MYFQDPFGDVKIPIIALFMIFSLLTFAVLSDHLKDKVAQSEIIRRCEVNSIYRNIVEDDMSPKSMK